MAEDDAYLEPAGTSEASLRDRGSRFLAYAMKVTSDDEVKMRLKEWRSRFPDATHHCYAYVLDAHSGQQRSSDDGEPAGSAGKPILRAILSAGISHVLVVVVRYFGGTQLGVPGLIKAYGEAAEQALALLPVQQAFREVMFYLEADFAHEQEIHRLAGRFGARVTGREYHDRVRYTLAVRFSRAAAFGQEAGECHLLKVSGSA